MNKRIEEAALVAGMAYLDGHIHLDNMTEVARAHGPDVENAWTQTLNSWVRIIDANRKLRNILFEELEKAEAVASLMVSSKPRTP